MAEITKQTNLKFKPTNPRDNTETLNEVEIPVDYVLDSKTLKTNIVIRGTDDIIATIDGYNQNDDKLSTNPRITESADDIVREYLQKNQPSSLASIKSKSRQTRSNATQYIQAGLKGQTPTIKQTTKSIINNEVKSGNEDVIEVSRKIRASDDPGTKDTNFIPPEDALPEEDAEPQVNLTPEEVESAFERTESTLFQQREGGVDVDSYIKTNGGLIYPIDMNISEQDYIKFYCCRFKPQMIEGFSFKDFDKQCTDFGPIYLPIGGENQDTNSVSWGENRMNPIQIAAFAVAKKALGDNALKDITNYLQQGRGILDEALPDIKSATSTYFAEQAAGVTGTLSRTQGAIFNPNLVLLFNNPEMRSFTLNFGFSARDKNEAETIRRIIRWFKQHMAVRRGNQNLFLLAPDIFTISYHMAGSGDIPHKSIGRKKLCALTSCSVNYTPDNSYMTFNDDAKTMTFYQMTLTFNEIEPVYYDDYTDEADVISY